MSRNTAKKVCEEKGHLIQSFTVKDVLDPVNKVVLHLYWTGCVYCGLPPEVIFRTQAPRNQKKKSQEAA